MLVLYAGGAFEGRASLTNHGLLEQQGTVFLRHLGNTAHVVTTFEGPTRLAARDDRGLVRAGNTTMGPSGLGGQWRVSNPGSQAVGLALQDDLVTDQVVTAETPLGEVTAEVAIHSGRIRGTAWHEGGVIVGTGVAIRTQGTAIAPVRRGFIAGGQGVLVALFDGDVSLGWFVHDDVITEIAPSAVTWGEDHVAVAAEDIEVTFEARQSADPLALDPTLLFPETAVLSALSIPTTRHSVTGHATITVVGEQWSGPALLYEDR